MTRRRAVWFAAASAVVLLVGAFVALRRRSAGTGVAAPAPRVELVEPVAPAPAVPPVAEPEDRVEAEERVEPDEQRLPTWARAAIVVAALLAFLAVSLIAKKV